MLEKVLNDFKNIDDAKKLKKAGLTLADYNGLKVVLYLLNKNIEYKNYSCEVSFVEKGVFDFLSKYTSDLETSEKNGFYYVKIKME